MILLYAPCYLDGLDDLGNDRLARNLRYLDYYRSIKKEIGFDRIVMIDNGSSIDKLAHLKGNVFNEYNDLISSVESSDLDVWHFQNSLKKTVHGQHDYPYCWRTVYFMRDLIEFYNATKIIFIDSDAFVVSKKLAEYVRRWNKGWHSLYCKKYDFPESSFHVINQDSFYLLKAYTRDGDFMSRNNKVIMEKSLPFTHVHKEFDCDRYGETRVPYRTGMDLYCQAPLDVPLSFR